MKTTDINIRDPFVLEEAGRYYLYGTRAANFGKNTGGFDVYVSRDLREWSDPLPCMDSAAFGMNGGVNWAPEVHKYRGGYYMFATFTRENGLRGTYILRSDSPTGPFVPHSAGAVTPDLWECLDGTLYLSPEGKPFLVFCHEHTQILDGTVCYLPLTDDLTGAAGEAVTLFAGSEPAWADPKAPGKHFITDGPFLFRSSTNALLMIWSTFVQGKYAQCVARSESGDIAGPFRHLPPICADDGGHGMIFRFGSTWMLTLHRPNQTNFERPVFLPILDAGDHLVLA